MDSNTEVETSGWWGQVEQLDLSSAAAHLPRATDMLQEAKHFLRLVIDLEPRSVHLPRANWYSAAHMSAVISIRDAAMADAEARLVEFATLPIAQEFFLRPDDPDPALRDPVGVNRAYREYRNLRTHRGFQVVSLAHRVLVRDLVDNPGEVLQRWFFAPLEGPDLKKLKYPLLTTQQRERFNDFVKSKSFVELAAHQLYLIGRALQNSVDPTRTSVQ